MPPWRPTRSCLLSALIALALAPAAAQAVTTDEIAVSASPTGVAAGPNDDLYVLTSAPSIVHMTPQGGALATSPLPAGNGGTDPTFSGGALWWIGTGTLERWTPGGSLSRYPLPVPSATISSLTPGADGTVWFVETGTIKAVGRISPDGTITTFPIAAGTPSSLSVDGTGQLWLNIDGDDNNWPVTARLSPTGTITPVSIPADPRRVAAAPSTSTVWFAASDFLCCYVVQSKVDYAYWLTPGTTGGPVVGGFLADMRVTDIIVGPDGNAWVTDGAGGHVGRLAVTGRMTLFPEIGLPTDAPIVNGPGGTMWFVEAGRLIRIALDQPAITTEAPGEVGQTFARVGATSSPRGSVSRLRFEYGTTTAYGTSTRWQDVGDGDAPVARTARLQDLTPGTTYHYRAVVESPMGSGPGADRTFTTTPLPPPPPTPPADIDGDGYAAAVDCNDRVASIYPGAPEIAGDHVDQDCDGADEVLPRFFPRVVAYFTSHRDQWSRFTHLVVEDVPAGARLQLACSGRGCRFQTWKTTVAHPADRLDLLKRLMRSRLAHNAVLELRMTLPGHIGTVVRWKVGPPPKPAVTCLVPGASKDTRCSG
jgi:streptogramin lyase